MIAIQVGNLLTYSIGIDEIDRAGQSVFSFAREDFPNKSITPVRARYIYNWVLSLAKQPMTESEKDDQLICFLELLNCSDDERRKIDEILVLAGVNDCALEKRKTLYNRSLHPDIYRHCSDLFFNGHYFHAVFEAAKIYNKAVQRKSRSEKDGRALMMEAWKPNGTLRITPCMSETDRNVQGGLAFLSAGLMGAIRNPTAHEPEREWPISEIDCLDILGFISFLMRKCDEAVYCGDIHE
jgi:uncharacterized protein (TIGR02391 family)